MRYRRMLILSVSLLLLLLPAAGCDLFSDSRQDDGLRESDVAQTLLNLSFEQIGFDHKPLKWYVGGDGYQGEIDYTTAQHGSQSLRIRFLSGDGFGYSIQAFPLEDGLDKTLRFSGYIKTEAITRGYAGLWMRVDGSDNKILAFDNMNQQRVTGTTDWTEYHIELPVHPRATGIVFGALHNGDGTAWFDTFSFQINGQPYQPEAPFEPGEAQLAWLTDHARTFDTAQPGGGVNDLQFLEDMVGSARIVSLGEGTHGTREFFQMKHRVVEFLATQMGFTIFAIEANMPEARALNRYVLFGEGDPRDGLDGIYFWTWNTEEVLAMIEWMRDYNQSGSGRMQFLGFDMQYPSVAMDNVEAFVADVDPVYAPTLQSKYALVRDVVEAHFQRNQNPQTTVDYDLWITEAEEVLQHLTEERNAYQLQRDITEVDWAIQDARIVLQAASSEHRDRSMAENVDWILDHSAPGEKIVLWAHNLHVKRSTRGYQSMGSFLDERHGTDMVIFGFGFHDGLYTAVGNAGLSTYSTSASEPGTAEWAFHRTGIPRFVLDLRNASAGDPNSAWLTRDILFRNIGSMAIAYAFKPYVLTDDYDAMIFFDQTHPSVLLH